MSFVFDIPNEEHGQNSQIKHVVDDMIFVPSYVSCCFSFGTSSGCALQLLSPFFFFSICTISY